jgi:hypothetical protein
LEIFGYFFKIFFCHNCSPTITKKGRTLFGPALFALNIKRLFQGAYGSVEPFSWNRSNLTDLKHVLATFVKHVIGRAIRPYQYEGFHGCRHFFSVPTPLFFI